MAACELYCYAKTIASKYSEIFIIGVAHELGSSTPKDSLGTLEHFTVFRYLYHYSQCKFNHLSAFKEPLQAYAIVIIKG